jgi:SEC-C motif-containing protein
LIEPEGGFRFFFRFLECVMQECPCGSVFPYTDCCGILIRGATIADTAEDLMRSRYTAHVVKEWDYLVQTRHVDERKDLKDLATANEGVEWKKLEVLHSSKGNQGDSEGEVTYSATFEKDGKTESLQETALFLKEAGQWYYCGERSKPKIAAPKASRSVKPFVRTAAKVGRNDPCTCGSGKKFKKCCGK